jgi:beta-glucosidase
MAAAQSYRDAQLPIETRVEDLLSRMTIEEKFWQLFMLAGSLDDGVKRYADGAFGFQLGGVCDDADAAITAACVDAIQRHFVEDTRLGIPVIFFEEALHGLVREGATAFPQAIGLAATFDTTLMHDVADAIAKECRARGIRQVLSPVVNIAEDVRWGRTEETYGEDPFLAAAMGKAFTSAFTRRGVITTPKHFVANVGAGGRDSYPIEIGERRLREVHLPPFSACIRQGGSRSVMTAYNSFDGSPCTASAWLNSTLLKQELEFPGFIISDAGAVGGANVLHFTASDYADATAKALDGGLDVIFQTAFQHRDLFFPPFADGRIAAEVIDRAAARVLRAKLALGLFEAPYVGPDNAHSAADLRRHRDLARRAAQEAIVLLKNDRGRLPLNRSLTQIAVLGPDAAAARLGGYSGPGNDKVSILDGIRRRAGAATHVVHAEGCPRVAVEYATVPAEYLTCEHGGDRQPGLLGTYYDNIHLAGDPVLTRVDRQILFHWTLASPDPARLRGDCYSVRWSGKLLAPATGTFALGVEGDDGFRLYLDGELLIDNWRKVSHRTLVVERRLEEGKEYDLRLEFHEPVGSGKVRLVWDHGLPTGGDTLAEAVALAAASDVAIVAVGIEEGEFRDRASLALPGRQEELITRVAATGTPTVVVLVGGSAVTAAGWLDHAAAVLDVWYPGEAGGEAVADILFGDVNPAGRLPISFPLAEGQLPLVYNHKPTGRGDDYLDVTGWPLFPFGHGLSYTEFEYGNLRLSAPEIAAGDSAVVRFAVQNIGAMAGDEVVQLYIHDEVASVARPVAELKGFQRVFLAPGETKALQFVIRPEMLTMLDRDLKPVIEPGDFRILIGASSRDIRLHTTLTVGM